MTSLEEAKDLILGPIGTPRRDEYEKELQEELDKLEKENPSPDENPVS